MQTFDLSRCKESSLCMSFKAYHFRVRTFLAAETTECWIKGGKEFGEREGISYTLMWSSLIQRQHRLYQRQVTWFAHEDPNLQIGNRKPSMVPHPQGEHVLRTLNKSLQFCVEEIHATLLHLNNWICIPRTAKTGIIPQLQHVHLEAASSSQTCRRVNSYRWACQPHKKACGYAGRNI